jgi:hypothetical protein
MPDTSSLLNLPSKMNDNKLHIVAEMMNHWTRTENNQYAQLVDLQAQQVSERNRYIAELQDDFHRVAQIANIQRRALRDFALAIEIMQDRINELDPNHTEAFFTAHDANRIPHVIRVDRTQWNHGEVIDLTTDDELEATQTTVMEEEEQLSQEF